MRDGDSKPSRRRRSLFWRLWVRALFVKRAQAGLALGSLLIGSALAATLLNLQSGVRREMTEEFRSYGANVVLSPVASSLKSGQAELMDEEVMARLAPWRERMAGLNYSPVLYVVTRLSKVSADPRLPEVENVVAVGRDFATLRALYPASRLDGSMLSEADSCVVGAHVASRLRARIGDTAQLESANSANQETAHPMRSFRIAGVLTTGAAEDDQVFIELGALQQLAGLAGKISLIEMTIPGESSEVERAIHNISEALPGVKLHPIRSIIESEGRALGTIRLLLISLTALILIIVGICVMATMMTIVLERKRDIAVMKALGASDGVVERLFLSEGAALGFLGGLSGFAAGLAAAWLIGRRLFDVNLGPTWWTFPLITAMAVVLALLATAFPVRMTRAIRPAVILKGE